ncbi:hypothetical protein [Bradyrhizobium sp.]|uniref:hypothetical protein n=1 Tax=Bradyrhizobium sp. TaxID=376 RepID=UPI003C4F12C4
MAATIIDFIIMVLHSIAAPFEGRRIAEPCAGHIAGVLLRALANIAICCKRDLPLAASGLGGENALNGKIVGKNPRH